MKKRRIKKSNKEYDLQDKSRQTADRLDRMRGWIDDVQADAAPGSKAFYTRELISQEHLLALRDILGELQGFNEAVEIQAEAPADDDDWEDEAE